MPLVGSLNVHFTNATLPRAYTLLCILLPAHMHCGYLPLQTYILLRFHRAPLLYYTLHACTFLALWMDMGGGTAAGWWVQVSLCCALRAFVNSCGVENRQKSPPDGRQLSMFLSLHLAASLPCCLYTYICWPFCVARTRFHCILRLFWFDSSN